MPFSGILGHQFKWFEFYKPENNICFSNVNVIVLCTVKAPFSHLGASWGLIFYKQAYMYLVFMVRSPYWCSVWGWGQSIVAIYKVSPDDTMLPLHRGLLPRWQTGVWWSAGSRRVAEWGATADPTACTGQCGVLPAGHTRLKGIPVSRVTAPRRWWISLLRKYHIV